MPDDTVIGWDIGGAHLKAAKVVGRGEIERVVQLPCPLWQGLSELESAIDAAINQLGTPDRHAVTMTGELTDLFEDRADGVCQITRLLTGRMSQVAIYAGSVGFLPPEQAMSQPDDVASANWHATARLVAHRLDQGLLLDIGSTTTDLIPFRQAQPRAIGYTDAQRLTTEELVYTGVTRTPVMAVTQAVAFDGERQSLMAESFANMADVYRLTGELPRDADQYPTLDGRGMTAVDSARRIARMLGRDLEQADLAAWTRIASQIAERQLQQIQRACDRVLSGGLITQDVPVIGAGVGRYLAEKLAKRLGRPYVDFASLFSASDEIREWAARCAPAVAVAALLTAA